MRTPFWPDELQQWMRSWRRRPLLWLALATVVGSAIGPRFAAYLGAAHREELALWWPCLPLIGLFAVATYFLHRHADVARLAFFGAVALLMMSRAAQRVLPPSDDVSSLVRAQMQRQRPLRALPAKLRGRVVTQPRRGEFSVSFALELDAMAFESRHVMGRVAVQAPGQTSVALGDDLEVRGALLDLPRVGNASERERQWSDILDSCWCRLEVKSPADVRLLQEQSGGWDAAIRAARNAIRARYERAFGVFDDKASPQSTLTYAYGASTAQLLTAMVFGEGGLREPLPRQVRDEFRAAGLSHLLVASGTQISFLALGLSGLSRLSGRRSAWHALWIVPLLLVYALIAGGAASIWRATLAGAVAVWALGLGRPIDAMSLWCAALGTLLIADPLRLFDLSLQLTFAATWGLIVLSPAIDRRLEGAWGNWPGRSFVALALGAQLATLPIVAYHFGRLSLAGFAANLPAVPLAGILVATGIVGLWLPLAPLNYALTQAVARVAHWAAILPGAQTETPPLSLPYTLLCYAGFGTLILSSLPDFAAHWRETQRAARDEGRRWIEQQKQNFHLHRSSMIGAILLITTLLMWLNWPRRVAGLHLTLLDVGQGECIVVRSPSGRVLLVDGGSLDAERGDIGRAVIVPYLQSIGVGRIDVMIVTHADADHCNGLREVVRALPVGLVLDGADPNTLGKIPLRHDASAADHDELLQELRRRAIPVQAAQAGQAFDLGDGATVRVLAPLAPRLPGTNDNAAVLKVTWRATSLLLTADIEQAAEARLVARGEDLRCTLLKVAHHGSKTSSTAAFLRATAPQMALISCGRYNRFGHPAAPTLQHLGEARVPVLRTDLDGTIEVDCDGQSCRAQTFRH